MKVVIIGGVAAGATAAARLRRLDKTAQIVLLEAGRDISYASCGLPYYVGGLIPDSDELIMRTPEGFSAQNNLDVRTHNRVTAIHPAQHTVEVAGPDGAYTESYDKLLLAVGAAPVVPPLPGVGLPGVFTLRGVEDGERLRAFIEAEKPRRAVVVGCGFVGLEAAEALAGRGLQVAAVDMAAQVLPGLDADMAAPVQEYLQQQGLRLLLGSGVKGIFEEGGALAVQAGDERLLCELVVLAAGVRPQTGIAAAAGIALDEKGYIVVDEHLRTSEADIYAAGDAVTVPQRASGLPARVLLAGPANRQGRIAAENIAGRNSTYGGTLGSAIVKLFGATVAFTGLSEGAARAAGLPCAAKTITAGSHAGYYPGSKPLRIKGVYHTQSGVLLGAQLFGEDGVDKRADVLAMAVYARMTAAMLSEVDLCYAPPYSSPSDPVNVLGNVIVREMER